MFAAPSASTVRHLYLRGGAGVGSMTKIYGGRNRNGVCPAHYSVGSKNVARKVLQALELLKMIEKDPNGWDVICWLGFAEIWHLIYEEFLPGFLPVFRLNLYSHLDIAVGVFGILCMRARCT